MLRCLAILAVIFAVAQAPVPASGQASDKSAQSAPKKKANGDTDKKPLLPSGAVVKPNAAAPAPKPEASEQHGDNQQNAVSIVETPSVPVVWSLHEKIAWGVNLALAGFAAFGVCIAIKTLKTVKRQTEASVTAAKAALRQANHIVASERAWIITPAANWSPELFATGTGTVVLNVFDVTFFNAGKTPAHLLERR
jgi:hypothetical protein